MKKVKDELVESKALKNHAFEEHKKAETEVKRREDKVKQAEKQKDEDEAAHARQEVKLQQY